MSEAATPGWADDDTEALFATLGKYWIIFQSVESLLDQVLLLAWGHENWAASQKKLAGMSNVQKIDRLESIVLTMPDFARVHTRPEWVSHFKSVIKVLHAEREERNSIIHSQILFEFVDKGLGPPLLSRRTKSNNEDERFQQRWLSKEYQSELLRRLGELTIKMNLVYVQLVHDFQASPDGISG